jgi:hypothetical protein
MLRDIGHWEVGLFEEATPHLHYVVPSYVREQVSPNALLHVLYHAAMTITAHLAEHHPGCPYLVCVDPEPKLSSDQEDDDVIYGCVSLIPSGAQGQKMLDDDAKLPGEYLRVMESFAESFQTHDVFYALIEPNAGLANEETNAPGSPSLN